MENDELNNKEKENKLELEPDQIEADFKDSVQEQPEVSDAEIEHPLVNSKKEPSEPYAPDAIKEVPEVKKMPNWLRIGLIFIGVSLLFLLIGYLISYFTTTVPTQRTYQTVLEELTNKENELSNLQTQFDQTSNDLQDTQNNLDRIQMDYQTLEQDHQQLLANSEFNQTLIDMKFEIGLARFALLNEDRISSRQAISLAREQFEKIRTLLDSDISTGIEDRLLDIQKLVSSDPEEAMDELRTLSENLERIPLR